MSNSSTQVTLFSSQRGYDNVGNVTSVNTTLAAGSGGTDTQQFCYDEQNRLVWAGSVGTPSCSTTAITPGSLTSAQYQQSYGYDALNRFVTGPLGTYLYGDSAHLHAATSTVSGYSASYDAAGDLTCRAPDSTTVCGGSSPTGAQLTYDNERRLSHWQNAPGGTPTTQADDLYDGSGARVEERVTSSSATTTTDYLADGVEEAVNGTISAKYYSAAGMTIGVNTSSGSTPAISYLASDGLGSVSEALDGNGNATAAQLYTPYGAVRYTMGAMPTSKGFTGQRADATIGLDYYGARYYDPTLGQFASADSVSDGLNRYGYVAGNPETLTDPTGHMRVGDGGGNATTVTAAHSSGTAFHTRAWFWNLLSNEGSVGDVSVGATAMYAHQATNAAKIYNQKTVFVRGYTRANGTDVAGGLDGEGYMRRAPGNVALAADAEAEASRAEFLGRTIGIAGLALDAGVTGYNFYARDQSDPTQLRTEKAVVAGVMHAAIVGVVSYAAVALVAAIPVVGETGVAEFAAGVAGGWLGGQIANAVVTPQNVTGATNFINNFAQGAGDVLGSIGV